ncbi:MAG: Pyridoxine/pyridoxamine 5'-phosphate oxidase [Opitutia bacterium UBA7350]|nr:MAG: Pyridoxine/pyridoxamine 5'-phosphate oxidase [Opitutae bacterium UBA7350]
MDLSDRRADYQKGTLDLKDLAVCPFAQFQEWYAAAEDCELEEPNAFCLATADLSGQPATRIVLLKDFSEKGLVFYTNYESRKAGDIEMNPQVSANFLWLPLQRQVNIAGRVERISKAESLKYFLSRPLASQLGAWTSPQSKVISSRQILETKWEQMKAKYAAGKIPLPDHWGGYRIVPIRFEFWQGRSSRLHDRFVYHCAKEGNWRVERLAP